MILRRAVAVLAIALVAVPAWSRPKEEDLQHKPQGSADTPSTVKKEEKTFPLGTSWLAASLNGKSFGGERPAFSLDQQFRAKGFGGCNTFAAVAYPLKEQGIAVGPFALTKKDCGKDVMALEHDFLVALRAAQKWDLLAGQLVIKGPAGELRFDRSI